jgi:hypothetical protein
MLLRALLAIVLAGTAAHADGEHGPMFGGAVVGAHGDEVDVAGVGVEIVQWVGPIALAVEGQRQWIVDDSSGPQLTSVAGSLRLLAFAHVMPSFLDPRDVVELGLELHGIVEQGWWSTGERANATPQYGLGAALRLRGATDDDRSNLLAESRVFVRAMWTRDDERDIAARGTLPASRAGVTVMIGLGALWGGGKRAYVDGLRRDPTLDADFLIR